MKKYRVVMAGRQEGDPEQEFSVQSIFTHDAAGYDDGDIALVKLKAYLEKLCTHFFRTRIVLSVLFKKDSCFLRQMLLQSFLYANNVSFRHFTQKWDL